MYTPALKARESELTALADAYTHGLPMFPLVEFVEHTGPAAPRGVMSEVAYSCEQLAVKWPLGHYVDVDPLASGPSEKTTALITLNAFHTTSSNPKPIPIVRLTDSSTVLTAAAPVAQASGHIAVRLPLTYMMSAPAGLSGNLANIAIAVGLSPSDLHIILDWGDSPVTMPLDVLETRTRAVLTAAGAGWGRIVVLGTAGPAQPTGEYHRQYERREWWVWLRLHHGPPKPQPVEFADYAGFPTPNPGFGIPRMATVRYSHGDYLHIVRRANTTRPARNGFQRCCDDIVSIPGFPGAGFSTGDATIVDVHNNAAYLAGAQGKVWRIVALQHHLARVVADQITPPPAPVPGTI